MELQTSVSSTTALALVVAPVLAGNQLILARMEDGRIRARSGLQVSWDPLAISLPSARDDNPVSGTQGDLMAVSRKARHGHLDNGLLQSDSYGHGGSKPQSGSPGANGPSSPVLTSTRPGRAQREASTVTAGIRHLCTVVTPGPGKTCTQTRTVVADAPVRAVNVT
eukprot:gene31178-40536_t